MQENPPPLPEIAPALTAPPEVAKRPPGAPIGNANRLRAGLKASKLPRDAKAEEMAGYAFRTLLVEALERIHGKGKIPVGLQSLIQTAHRNEIRARLAARWYRREGEKLPLLERLKLQDVVCAASEARDKVIARLGLLDVSRGHGSDGDDVWAELDRQRAEEAIGDAALPEAAEGL